MNPLRAIGDAIGNWLAKVTYEDLATQHGPRRRRRTVPPVIVKPSLRSPGPAAVSLPASPLAADEDFAMAIVANPTRDETLIPGQCPDPHCLPCHGDPAVLQAAVAQVNELAERRARRNPS